MWKWLITLAMLSVCYAPTQSDARVWSGLDLMHLESAASSNMCALTFDDGPAGHTEHLLDVLRAEGIPATFFMLGRLVEARPDLVQRVAAEGHDIGIHSYSHPNMKRQNMDRQANELVRSLLAIQHLGYVPRWFRPPYGNMNASLKELAAYLGLSVVIWTHDSKDWKRTRSDYANMETIMGPQPEGSLHGVFLFHDTSARTAEELPKIISILRERGCQRFVTMSEFTGETERPMPSRQDEKLFAQAGLSLQKVLNGASTGPYATEAAYLASVIKAVEHESPLPALADAGLRQLPLNPVTETVQTAAATPPATGPALTAVPEGTAQQLLPAHAATAAKQTTTSPVPAVAPALTSVPVALPAEKSTVSPTVFSFSPVFHTTTLQDTPSDGEEHSSVQQPPASHSSAASVTTIAPPRLLPSQIDPPVH